MSNHSSRHQARWDANSGNKIVGGARAERTRRAAARRKSRRFTAEQLENRALMAADVNPWHNELFPIDVDGDVNIAPLDALLVINELNAGGSRSLLASSALPMSASPVAKVDVDGDGYLAPGDALTIINNLNGEGEGEQVQFGLKATSLTSTTALSSFQVGDHFRLSGTVADLRTGGGGVFAAYVDVVYDASRFRIVERENQLIAITGSPDDGTFTLTFNGQTTAPITFDPANSQPTTTSIRTALEALSNIDPGEIEVVNGPSAGSSWYVKFGGKRYGNTNVPNMTGAGTFNGGTSPSVSITEHPGSVPVSGEPDSIRNSVTYGTSYPNVQSATDGDGAVTNSLDELGAVAGLSPLGTGAKQFFTFEFEAIAAGVGNFSTNPAELSPAHDVLLFGQSGSVDDALIIYPTLPLTITQPANAVGDAGAATEDQTTSTRVNVLANDTTTNGQKFLQNFSTTSANGGTVARFTNGTTSTSDDQLDYRPAANFFGTDTFTYVLGDAATGGNTATGTVTITVSGVNDAPTLTAPTTSTTNEDVALAFTGANAISVADIDVGASNVSVSFTSTNGVVAVGGGSTGLITAGANNSTALTLTGTVAQVNTALAGLTYTPNQNFNGSGTVATTVNDLGNTGSGGAKSASKTTTITISAQNDAPVNAVPGSQTVAESTALVFNSANGNAITISDVDVGSGTMTVTLGVAHGKLVLGSTTGLSPLTGNNSASITMTGTLANLNAALNNLTYTPTTDYTGPDSLSILTDDKGNTGAGGAKTDSDAVAIDVIPNARPRAFNDTATVNEDSSSNVITVGTNDVLNPGATIILKSATNGAHGTTSLSGSTVLYTPAANYFGSDTFTYVINDSSGAGDDSTGTVTVTVTPVNDAPVPQNDSRFVDEDVTTTFPASDLIGNDSPGAGEAGQPLTVTAVGAASVGTVTLIAGQISYSPPASFNGDVTFTYTVTDSGASFGNPLGLTGTATVTLSVVPVNDPPIAGADSASGVEDNAVTISFSSLLANDNPGGGTAEASQQLTVTGVAVTDAATGTAVLDTPNQRIVFTPAADFNGVAALTYTVTDDGLPNASSTGQITVTISEVNDAPTAAADSVTAVKNVVRTYSAGTLLGNDSKGPANEGGQTLRITAITSGPTHGTAVLNGDGTVTYTPNTDYVGPDAFTYEMRDDGTTAGDDDFKFSSALVSINVLDYIPMHVSGYVYFDHDNDGVKDEDEVGLAGVEVTLAGTDFEGHTVGPTTIVTDRGGYYEFQELAPGDYTITESQPTNTTDGAESVVDPLELDGNDVLVLNVSVEDNVNLPTHELTGNNFGERGMGSAFASIQSIFELFASSAGSTSEMAQGLVFSFEDASAEEVDWYQFLNGWDGYLSADLELAPDRLSAVLTVVNASQQTLTTTVTVASARLRVKTDAAGNTVVHVVGDAGDFTFAQAGGGEGEGPDAYDDAVLVAARARANGSTAETIRAVDAALASGEVWS